MISILKAALDAAMTTVPRLLMADWMTILDRANTALWMPAGRPIMNCEEFLCGNTARV